MTEKPQHQKSMPFKKNRRLHRKGKKDATVFLLKVAVILLAAVLIVTGIYKHGAKRSDAAIVVALDAAHDSDAYGMKGLINEGEFTGNVVSAIEAELKKDPHFAVIRTHTADQEASVKRRVEAVNVVKPDILISVACDGSSMDAEKKGTVIYADIPSKKSNADSLKFASIMQECFKEAGIEAPVDYYYYKPIGNDVFQSHIVDSSDTTDYQEDTFAILQKTVCPAIVIRQIYVTNASDVDTWANQDGYAKLAGIYVSALQRMYKDNR